MTSEIVVPLSPEISDEILLFAVEAFEDAVDAVDFVVSRSAAAAAMFAQLPPLRNDVQLPSAVEAFELAVDAVDDAVLAVDFVPRKSVIRSDSV